MQITVEEETKTSRIAYGATRSGWDHQSMFVSTERPRQGWVGVRLPAEAMFADYSMSDVVSDIICTPLEEQTMLL
ncbi:hypothetical protein J6590_034639 [Homalodisca vitripennis]|nr:hypothetical protein J6590_034639 [Homalodisca vitripennis]